MIIIYELFNRPLVRADSTAFLKLLFDQFDSFKEQFLGFLLVVGPTSVTYKLEHFANQLEVPEWILQHLI